MRYILKLTAFALLGLLLVSCSKSSSGSKHNASIKLQGVLEKGKATDALCKITTLDGKAYSKSNHIENGGYVASVPAGAFDVVCTIRKYIDDKTGETRTPTPSIVLETISFAKAGKNKIVNVNVITDLVAKELTKSKNKITSESSFYTVREDAERVALRDIKAEVKQDIGDIDTLSLQDKGVLAKVSLAIQEQIDDLNSHITTVSGALQAAENANSIAMQDVNDLSLDAIATPLPKTETLPKPTGQTKAIILTGATIGGKAVTLSPTDIDITQEVAFSIPTDNLGEVAASDSVYITSDKAGQTKPIQLEGGKSAPYTSVNVKGLFNSDGVTNFIVCVVTTMAKLDSTANAQCHNADRKVIFIATAASSAEPGNTSNANLDNRNPNTIGTGTGGTQAPAGEIGTGTGADKGGAGGTGTKTTVHAPTITLTAATTIDGQDVTQSPTNIDISQNVAFLLSANDVRQVTNADAIYITSDKKDSRYLPVAIAKDKTKYENSDISELFKGDGTETTFTICIFPASTSVEGSDCLNSLGKQTFTATASTTAVNHATIDELITASIQDSKGKTSGVTTSPTDIDTSISVGFYLPISLVHNLGGRKIYIMSDLQGSAITVMTPSQVDGDDSLKMDIKDLFKTDGSPTTFSLCIVHGKVTRDSCKKTALQTFTATAIRIVNPTLSAFIYSANSKIITINNLWANTATPVSFAKSMLFSLPTSYVHNLGNNGIYITSNKSGASLLPLNPPSGTDTAYTAELHDLYKPSGTTLFNVCILPKTSKPTASDCNKLRGDVRRSFQSTI